MAESFLILQIVPVVRKDNPDKLIKLEVRIAPGTNPMFIRVIGDITFELNQSWRIRDVNGNVLKIKKESVNKVGFPVMWQFKPTSVFARGEYRDSAELVIRTVYCTPDNEHRLFGEMIAAAKLAISSQIAKLEEMRVRFNQALDDRMRP